MLGAALLLSALEAQGVDVVFGLPGGSVIPLYDCLKDFNIRHILTRHEQGAVHAADGYARATGKVGVCFATSGPGATNLVTGIATAQMDSIPLVCITGQVSSPLLGKDSFQEAYTVGICQPVTKHTYAITKASEIPDVVAEAFFVAKTGRPGPVVIDIPKDIFTQEAPPAIDGGKVRERVALKFKAYTINKEQVRKAAKMLTEAQKPVMIVGGGVNISEKNHRLLTQLVEKTQIPVSETLMGRGVFTNEGVLNLGMLGMHGTTAANYAVQNADVILAIGMRFDDRVTSDVSKFAPKAKIIHVDIDPAEIGKNVAVDLPIVADSEEFLTVLNEVMAAVANRQEWLDELKAHTKMVKSPANSVLPPKEMFAVIDKLLDEDTIVVTDVGQHQMWAALFLNPRRTRRFLTSGGAGTMGYGFPAAIGAKFGQPDKKVVLITGDGSFQMNLQELAVVKKFRLPIKICLVNNGYLGMVRQWQEMFHNGNYAETTLDAAPNWQRLAQAYDINYVCIENLDDAAQKLAVVFNDDEPYLIDLLVDHTANVYPMVPAGCGLDEIVGDFENEA